MKQWFNNDAEQQKKDRRAAAKAFLEKTASDSTIWNEVRDDRKKAKEHFRTYGDIDVPPEVEVICVDPDTRERDKLVVFLLPEPNTQNVDPLKYWLAAWIPY
jgi:hypothetical protein